MEGAAVWHLHPEHRLLGPPAHALGVLPPDAGIGRLHGNGFRWLHAPLVCRGSIGEGGASREYRCCPERQHINPLINDV